MNHLPWPKNGEFPPPEVPYVCSGEPELDVHDYQGHPFKQSWSTPQARHKWMDCPPETAAIRAQSWLFFGLLSVFLGRRFRRIDFIRLSQKSNAWILDTSILPQHLADLVRSAKKGTLASDFDLPDLESVGKHWNQAFWAAKLECEVLHVYMNFSMGVNLMLIELPLPILLLSLQRMANRIFWRKDVVPTMCKAHPVPSKFSLWRMMESEWCDSQAVYFYRVHSPFLNHYLSGLPRKLIRGNHGGCTWNKCVGDNVDEATYKPRHTGDSCHCPHLGPDTHKIADYIDAGRIPLIRLSIHNGQPRLDVVAADIDTRYMSISHVWIGGLGNFEDNKLPQCQLLRLYGLLNNLHRFRPPEPPLELFRSGLITYLYNILGTMSAALSYIGQSWILWRHYYQRLPLSGGAEHLPTHQHPMTFWMDTLCIPVDPRHQALRRKAIDNMALTYALAERCLVLDPELCQISMKGLSTTQLNAHVLCSSWVRRSWTFQEARLSRVWYAQFADGLWNPNSMENAALEHRLYSDWNLDKSDEHQVASDSIMWYHDMPASRQTDILKDHGQRTYLHYPQYNFQVGWNNLMARSTSKPEDVHGIFANTLDLSAGEVLALPLQDRMKAILGTQATLSAGLVYSRGHKIHDPANRWVPLFPSGHYISDNYGQMKPVDGGYLLDKVKGDPVGFIVGRSTPRYSKLRIIESSGTVGPLWIDMRTEDDGSPVHFEAPGHSVAVCYVVGDFKQSLEQNTISHRMQGARFALRRIEGQTLHLVYEYSFAYTHQKRHLKDNEHEFPIVYAERTVEDAIFQLDCDFTSWPTLTYRRDILSKRSTHGIEFYLGFWALLIALLWAPFCYLAGVSTRSLNVIKGIGIFILRAVVGVFELRRMQNRVNEHAYKAWVKTFDQSGCLRKRDDHDREKQQGLEISTRVKVSLGLGIGICIIAALLEGWEYLRWFGVALLLEVLIRWGVEKMWWKTRVKRWVKGFLKGREWW